MNPKELRERLGLSRADWARALGVGERTIMRWENEGYKPQGLFWEILRGIDNALMRGADPKLVGRKIAMGIGSLIFLGLTGSEMKGGSTWHL